MIGKGNVSFSPYGYTSVGLVCVRVCLCASLWVALYSHVHKLLALAIPRLSAPHRYVKQQVTLMMRSSLRRAFSKDSFRLLLRANLRTRVTRLGFRRA